MKIAATARPFPLNQVRLPEGPWLQSMVLNQRYLHSLDADRLLHTFRINAGLPSRAEPLGGWEEPACELRGHSLGHYLSGCALSFSSMDDEALKRKAEAIVAALAQCQQSLATRGANAGYLSAFPESFIDRVEACEPVWAPWYTLHKIMAGLLDVYVHCGSTEALNVLTRMAAWVNSRVSRLTEEQMQKSLKNEFGGMNDVLACLYGVTGDPAHLRLARRFDHQAIFDPLARGEDTLGRLHANTQIPKAIGAAREYELTGERRYHDIARYFWQRVTEGRCLCTGGTSNYEYFVEHGKLAGSLSVESQETCCTYNMLKLARHLFCWEPSAAVADYYERAHLNGILATQHPKTGMYMYYVSMKPGHWKIFSRPLDAFWCCVGTGMESHAKHGDSIYFHDDEGIYVNLFIASELRWPERGLRARQETRFPEEEGTTLTLLPQQPVELTVRIRIPSWAERGVRIAVNGEEQAMTLAPSSYAVLRRVWRNGDTIAVKLPMSLRLHHMPDDPKLAAVMYGPVALAGRLGREKLREEMEFEGDQRGQHNGPSINVPALATDGQAPEQWVKPKANEPLTFATCGVGRPRDVELTAFHKLFDERYSVYWRLTTEDAWRQAEDGRRRFEARLVDQVVPQYCESEGAHDMKSEKSAKGETATRGWRRATDGGWFSYSMRVAASTSLVLRCTYWGGDAGSSLAILVDDVPLARCVLNAAMPDSFFNEEYPLPAKLLQGKERVVVKFQADPQSVAGGVFAVAVLKA
jgi:hypothetical protein